MISDNTNTIELLLLDGNQVLDQPDPFDLFEQDYKLLKADYPSLLDFLYFSGTEFERQGMLTADISGDQSFENYLQTTQSKWNMTVPTAPIVKYEQALNDFFSGISLAAQAFEAHPTQITSQNVLWGTLSDGVNLEVNLSQISNVDELVDSINQGLETGALTKLALLDAGREVLSVNFTGSSWLIASDDLFLEIQGTLPTSLSEAIELIEKASDLYNLTFDDQTPEQRNDLVRFLKNYEISQLKISQTDNFDAALSLKNDEITLQVNELSVRVKGFFPVDLASVIDFSKLQEQDEQLWRGDDDGVWATGIVVENAVSGPFIEFDTTAFRDNQELWWGRSDLSLTINGSAEAEELSTSNFVNILSEAYETTYIERGPVAQIYLHEGNDVFLAELSSDEDFVFEDTIPDVIDFGSGFDTARIFPDLAFVSVTYFDFRTGMLAYGDHWGILSYLSKFIDVEEIKLEQGGGLSSSSYIYGDDKENFVEINSNSELRFEGGFGNDVLTIGANFNDIPSVDDWYLQDHIGLEKGLIIQNVLSEYLIAKGLTEQFTVYNLDDNSNYLIMHSTVDNGLSLHWVNNSTFERTGSYKFDPWLASQLDTSNPLYDTVTSGYGYTRSDNIWFTYQEFNPAEVASQLQEIDLLIYTEANPDGSMLIENAFSDLGFQSISHLEDLALSNGHSLNSWYQFGISSDYTNNGYQLYQDIVDGMSSYLVGKHVPYLEVYSGGGTSQSTRFISSLTKIVAPEQDHPFYLDSEQNLKVSKTEDLLLAFESVENIRYYNNNDELVSVNINAIPGAINTIGSRGHDALIGSDALDTIMGYLGDDELNGFSGDDILDGGEGSDWITGGYGDDWISGGDDHEADILAGGPGIDTFYFPLNSGDDAIADFDPLTDILYLENIGGVSTNDLALLTIENGDYTYSLQNGSTVTLKGFNGASTFDYTSNLVSGTVVSRDYVDANNSANNVAGVVLDNTMVYAAASTAASTSEVFIRAVDLGETSTFEIVVRPTATASAVDVTFSGSVSIDNLQLGTMELDQKTDLVLDTDFYTEDQTPENWDVQFTDDGNNTFIISALDDTQSEMLMAGQEYVLATFDVTPGTGGDQSPSLYFGSVAVDDRSQDDITVDLLAPTAVDANGYYEFEVENGVTVMVDAEKDYTFNPDEIMIRSYDALQALETALNKPGHLDSLDAMIAADITQDGAVRSFDALQTLQNALNKADVDYKSEWVFVDSDFLGQTLVEAGLTRENIDSPVAMVDTVTADLTLDLTGILLGDVDGSYADIMV